MKDMKDFRASATDLFARAKAALAADMKARGIGMILWDNAQTNFHYLPTVVERKGAKADVLPVMGLYLYDGSVWLIEDVDDTPVKIDDFYNPATEVRPVAVTLSLHDAAERIGNPAGRPGLADGGSLEEWMAIADCYFQALNDLPV